MTTDTIKALAERLREDARTHEKVTQMMADDKTARNRAAEGVPNDGPGYMGVKAENSHYWQAADLLDRLATQQSGDGVRAHQQLRELWEAIEGGPKPRCRDCADENGTCPTSNLPCDPQARALAQISLLRGVQNIHLTSERGEAVQQEAVRKLVFRIRERSINRLHNREFQMTLNDCVRELAAPVWPRIADGGQWRTIESAPKDGQDVLLYFPLEGLSDSFEKTIIAHWRKKVNDAGEYWVWQGRSYRGYSIEYQPTHWMPLPAPPDPIPVKQEKI